MCRRLVEEGLTTSSSTSAGRRWHGGPGAVTDPQAGSRTNLDQQTKDKPSINITWRIPQRSPYDPLNTPGGVTGSDLRVGRGLGATRLLEPLAQQTPEQMAALSSPRGSWRQTKPRHWTRRDFQVAHAPDRAHEPSWHGQLSRSVCASTFAACGNPLPFTTKKCMRRVTCLASWNTSPIAQK